MSDGIRAAAQALREALTSFDPTCIGAEDCAGLADELATTEKACGAARMLAVQRAAERGLHREMGFTDAAAWFARQGGTTTSQARQALDAAAGLDGLEQTKRALLAGEVSIAQAAEITNAEAESPGQEQDLLAVAKRKDLSGLRDHVRQRRIERTGAEELHRLHHQNRRFRHWRDGLGMVRFEGALPPEAGVPFVNRIEQFAQRLRRSARSEGAVLERFDAYAADALIEFCAGSSADAVPHGPRAEIVFVCDLFAYRRQHAHDGEVCHIVDGGPVPVAVVEDFAADAFVKAVLHDGSRIHSVKHFGRHLPAELRTALDLGPIPAFTGRQCADCERRYGLEYDHLDPVANFGPTSYDNLVARCYPDHQAKTERDRKAGLLGKGQRDRQPQSQPRRKRQREAAAAPVGSRAGPGPEA